MVNLVQRVVCMTAAVPELEESVACDSWSGPQERYSNSVYAVLQSGEMIIEEK